MLKTNTNACGLKVGTRISGKQPVCFSRAASERITSCSSGSSDMPPGTQREPICHCRTIPAFCFPIQTPAARLFNFTMCALGSQEAGDGGGGSLAEGQCHYSALQHCLKSSSAAAHFSQFGSRYPFTDETVGADATFKVHRKIFS